jgi:signal transduction histidine kinase
MLRRIVIAIGVAAGTVGLLLLGSFDFLLVHSLGEVFSAVVGVAVFLVAWNVRGMLGEQPLLMTLGVALLFVGIVDILHALAYRGMGVFEAFAGGPDTTNLATQLWIVARVLFAVALLAGLLLQSRGVRPEVVLGVTTAATAALLTLVFTGLFPDCFLPGSGLTPFKIDTELGVTALLAASWALLRFRRKKFDPRVVRLVSWAVVFTITSELCFVLYRDPFALINAVGHVLKIAAYIMLYLAIVQLGLREPYALLFRDLKQSETALAAANRTLERRVAIRTAELETRQEELRALALELTLVERRERRRLATLLHDELAQLLATVKVRLEVLFKTSGTHDGGERERLEGLLDEAMTVTRDLIAELAPPRLHLGGLVEALEALTERMASHHGLRVEMVAAPDLPEIDGETRETAFNAVRELLMNTAKHSGASRARVEVTRADSRMLRLVVEDCGVGFDPEHAARLPRENGGFGLFNLRQQIDLLGGELRLVSAPAAGTRAEVLLPLPHPTPTG